MDNETTKSPFSALRSGATDRGVQDLARLMHEPDADPYRLVLNLYNFEQERPDLLSGLTSARLEELRLIKMKLDRHIEDDLKKRGIVLDYPPHPEDGEDVSHRDHLDSLWRVLERVPKAVIAAGLKEAVIVLPYGKRPLPHAREGFSEEYSGACITVKGENVIGDAGNSLSGERGFSINALPIDLTQGAEIILQRGRRNQQSCDNSPTQPEPTIFDPIPLVEKKEDGLFHVDVGRIVFDASFDEGIFVPLPLIIDPLQVLPTPVSGNKFFDLVSKIRQQQRLVD